MLDGLPIQVRDRLTLRQLVQLNTLLELLERDEHAPTTVRRPKQALGVHLADSLVALEVQPLREARRITDLGAGSGFPGLALAVALPDATVELIESRRRKCDFLERACAHARIANARVVCVRAEEWSDGIGRQEAVVARALAPQPVVLEYAAPLLRIGGVLVDWRGQRDREQERQSAAAAQPLGLGSVRISHTTPFEGARDHHLHVFEKVASTPPRFPRRAGIARKRPLGC